MDTSPIENMGLSNAEVRIYVALLELGPSKSGDIIRKTKLQSSTVYHVIGQLLEKGLISYLQRGKLKIFSASPPETILEFHEEKKEAFQKMLPELKTLHREHKTNAAIYYGIKGLGVAYSDILKTLKKGDSYCFFQISETTIQNQRTKLFFRNYHLKRAEKGIIVRALASQQAKNAMKEIFNKLPRSELRYTNTTIIHGITVYADKVITIDWDDEEPIVFVMQSKSIADHYRKFFESEWEKAKR